MAIGPRIQSPGGPNPVAFRPGANPVDSFVQPTAGSKLAQVARGLSQLVPSLSRFTDVLTATEKDKSRIEGQAAAEKANLEHHVSSFKDAIDKGIIKPSQSPIFRQAAQETFGRIAANKYSAQLQINLAQSDVNQSDNPEDFNKFEADQRQQFIKQTFGGDEDPALLASFHAQAEGQAQGQRDAFASAAAQRVEKNAYQGLFQETMQNVLTKGTGAVAALQAIQGVAVLGGANRRRINLTMANAVIEAARRAGTDPLMAQTILDQLKGGTGSISTLPEVTKALSDLKDNISSQHYEEAVRQEGTENRDKQHKIDAVLSEYTSALDGAKDPSTIDANDFARRINLVDPGSGEKAFQLRDAYTQRTFQDDPAIRSDAFLGVYGMDPTRKGHYLTIRDAGELLASRHLTVGTYSTLVNQIQERDTKGAQNTFSNDPVLSDAISSVRRMIVSNLPFDNPTTAMYREGAVSDFTYKYMAAVLAHPGMSEPERIKLATDLKTSVVPRFVENDNGADLLHVPRASPTTGLVDWQNGPIADKSMIQQLKTETNERRQMARYHYSPLIEQLLATYHILPKDVDTFLQKQLEFSTR